MPTLRQHSCGLIRTPRDGVICVPLIGVLCDPNACNGDVTVLVIMAMSLCLWSYSVHLGCFLRSTKSWKFKHWVKCMCIGKDYMQISRSLIISNRTLIFPAHCCLILCMLLRSVMLSKIKLFIHLESNWAISFIVLTLTLRSAVTEECRCILLHIKSLISKLITCDKLNVLTTLICDKKKWRNIYYHGILLV